MNERKIQRQRSEHTHPSATRDNSLPL